MAPVIAGYPSVQWLTFAGRGKRKSDRLRLRRYHSLARRAGATVPRFGPPSLLPRCLMRWGGGGDSSVICCRRFDKQQPSVFRQDLLSVLRSGLMADTTIRVGGEQIAAHGIILAARSEHFATVLTSDFAEGAGRQIEIEDATPEGVRALLHYFYTDEVPPPPPPPIAPAPRRQRSAAAIRMSRPTRGASPSPHFAVVRGGASPRQRSNAAAPPRGTAQGTPARTPEGACPAAGRAWGVGCASPAFPTRGTEGGGHFARGFRFFRFVPKCPPPPPSPNFFCAIRAIWCRGSAANILLLEGGTSACALHVRSSIDAGADPKHFFLRIAWVPSNDFVWPRRIPKDFSVYPLCIPRTGGSGNCTQGLPRGFPCKPEGPKGSRGTRENGPIAPKPSMALPLGSHALPRVRGSPRVGNAALGCVRSDEATGNWRICAAPQAPGQCIEQGSRGGGDWGLGEWRDRSTQSLTTGPGRRSWCV